MKKLKPLVKWVGGKRQLLSDIHRLIPSDLGSGTYFEPFLGGGAVLLSLQPERAFVNDINAELVNLYETVRDHPEELIEIVTSYPYEKSFYYELRALDRKPELWKALSSVEKAARTLYLNRAGFNGLYRVNSKGEYNVPFGRYKTLNFDTTNILEVSRFLNRSAVSFSSFDYRQALCSAKAGDFVYLDPPYDPINATSSFTAYASGGFTRDDQLSLRSEMDRLTSNGVHVMLSNSATEFILDLYSPYQIHLVQARRQVNSRATSRGPVDEVIVTNYGQNGEFCSR